MTAKKLAYLDENGAVPAALLAGVPRVLAFPFDASTAGIATGYDTGYSPAVGDLLLDAWVDVVEPWNGTTPKANFTLGDDAFSGAGILGAFGHNLDTEWITDNYLPGDLANTQNGIPLASDSAHEGQVPSRVTVSHPIKVWVTQDGKTTGAATAATVGSAVLYLLVVSPGNV